MAKIGRNDPSPCGSGKKYKKCHLNREAQPVFTEGEVKGMASSHKIKKTCFHPLAGNNACKGKIINSHTVSKSGSLKKIARNGKVLHFKPDVNSLFETGGNLVAKEVGVSQASTFLGFCQHHDKEMFAPVEDKEFESTPFNCFLLGFRALTKEIYAKQFALELIPKMRELDRGKEPHIQTQIQLFINAHKAGIELAIRDLYHYKGIYDQAFKTDDYSESFFYVIKHQETPNILFSGVISPEFDFTGNALQKLGTAKKLDSLSVNAIALPNGGAVVFHWMGESAINEQLITSLHEISNHKKASAITQFAFESFENLFINPAWWSGIGSLCSELEKRVLCGATTKMHTNRCFVPTNKEYYVWADPQIESNII